MTKFESSLHAANAADQPKLTLADIAASEQGVSKAEAGNAKAEQSSWRERLPEFGLAVGAGVIGTVLAMKFGGRSVEAARSLIATVRGAGDELTGLRSREVIDIPQIPLLSRTTELPGTFPWKTSSGQLQGGASVAELPGVYPWSKVRTALSPDTSTIESPRLTKLAAAEKSDTGVVNDRTVKPAAVDPKTDGTKFDYETVQAGSKKLKIPYTEKSGFAFAVSRMFAEIGRHEDVKLPQEIMNKYGRLGTTKHGEALRYFGKAANTRLKDSKLFGPESDPGHYLLYARDSSGTQSYAYAKATEQGKRTVFSASDPEGTTIQQFMQAGQIHTYRLRIGTAPNETDAPLKPGLLENIAARRDGRVSAPADARPKTAASVTTDGQATPRTPSTAILTGDNFDAASVSKLTPEKTAGKDSSVLRDQDRPSPFLDKLVADAVVGRDATQPVEQVKILSVRINRDLLRDHAEPAELQNLSALPTASTRPRPHMYRINPPDALDRIREDNCVACVTAVIRNNLGKPGANKFETAHDVEKQFGSTDESMHLNRNAARNYIIRATGLNLSKPRNFSSDQAEVGQYALFLKDQRHVLYGEVAKDGSKFIFDPQISREFDLRAANLVTAYRLQQLHEASSLKQLKSKSNIRVEGTVERILPNTIGEHGPHQRFDVKLNGSGELLHVAHNIREFPVVPLHVGAAVRMQGELVRKGNKNLLHWTHRSPGYGNKGGWIELDGQMFL